MTLFPQGTGTALPRAEALPVCREVGWDFAGDAPLFRRGEPVVVEKAAAVRVWAWKALRTVRGRLEMYSWDYGCEVENLIGQAYTGELKRAEAARYVREALERSPYIKSVDNVTVDFDGDVLRVTCTLATVYGQTEVSGVV